MWLLERMLPSVTAYNVPRLLRAAGRLDATALQTALDTVVARHDVVRTSVVVVEGAPRPRVDPDARVELAVHELGDETRVDELVAEIAWAPFDLERDALLRAALLRLPDHDRLLLVGHHLVSDHGSAAVLLGELAAAYEHALAGNTPDLRELPIRYSDFAAWQRERFRGPMLDELVAYWRRQLDGAPDRLDLPSDRPRPPAKTYAGAEARSSLRSTSRSSSAGSRERATSRSSRSSSPASTPCCTGTQGRRTSSWARRSPAATTRRPCR